MSSQRGSVSRRRPELLAELTAAGRAVSDAVVMFHTALADKLGLRASDWKTLGLLEQFGALTHGELVQLSGLAPASVSGIVDRLERSGWVRRVSHPEDGRRVVVEMDDQVAAEQFGVYFEGLLRRIHAVYARYDDEQLSLLLEFMREVARCQKEATLEISA